MALKTFKPYTKSTRGTVIVTNQNLWKGKPIKSLTIGKKSSSGRNNLGRITSRRKGSGHKQRYREIDFYRNKHDMEAEIERIEYDPNRTSYIMLVKYTDGSRSYMLLPQNIKIGEKIISGNKKEIKIGNCMPLHDIPIGTAIHNVEMQPGGGAKIARAAGSSVQITGSVGEYSLIKLPSGEIRKINSKAKATIGVLSNPDQKNIKIGKAGRSRWLGIRPSVRGVVMNPVDHPHGGGEGKSSGGRNPVSPWGQSAKGLKTRNNKRTNKYIISRSKKRF
jgi:large subunit ribosomal protein L2